MKVLSFRLSPYALPLVRPLPTAAGVIQQRRGIIVQLETEQGRGLGEVAPHPRITDQDWRALMHATAQAAEALVGRSLREILATGVADLEPSVAMGFDMAVHDALARSAGVSLANLLGSSPAAGVSSSALLASPAAVASARRCYAAGYRVAKLKAHSDAEQTMRELLLVRQAEPALRLRLDINGLWDRTTALDFCQRLPAQALEWIEQPVAPQDIEGMRAVRATGVRVAADESARHESDIELLATEQAADVIVLKLFQVGGLAPALRMAARARRSGLEICLTTGIDSGIATAAVLHLAAAVHPETACGFSTLSLLQGDLIEEEIVEGAWMDLPTDTGLGVRLKMPSVFLGEEQFYESA